MLEAGGIMDMDFPRPAFTWLNGRQGAAKIQERIDWCWCNASWRLKVSGAVVQHLPRILLDHHLVLIT